MQVLAQDDSNIQEHGRNARVRERQLRDENEEADKDLPDEELQRHRARFGERQMAQLVPSAWRPAPEGPLGPALAGGIASSRGACQGTDVLRIARSVPATLDKHNQLVAACLKSIMQLAGTGSFVVQSTAYIQEYF